MSVSSVSGSSLLSQSMQSWQTRAQNIQSEFQQLGKDLQAGNITQAQSDFSTLSQNLPSSVQTNSSLSKDFSALGTALQSGNVSAAQQAYTSVQNDIQQTGQSSHHHHHHHGGGSGQSGSSNSSNSSLAQLFGSLGSDLQAGNLSAAQTAYTTLQQDLQQMGWGTATSSQSTSGTVSVLS